MGHPWSRVLKGHAPLLMWRYHLCSGPGTLSRACRPTDTPCAWQHPAADLPRAVVSDAGRRNRDPIQNMMSSGAAGNVPREEGMGRVSEFHLRGFNEGAGPRQGVAEVVAQLRRRQRLHRECCVPQLAAVVPLHIERHSLCCNVGTVTLRRHISLQIFTDLAAMSHTSWRWSQSRTPASSCRPLLATGSLACEPGACK